MPESKFSSELKTKLKKPKMYVVIMHNDDYTTMRFVVEVLIQIFNKSSIEASELMMKIHTKGNAVIGIYTYDIAVTKKLLADKMAKQREFPLKITIDEE
ncbi:MAG: ATP-dependent Clp protease adaptor ClpS [Clostridiales bacterium]|nr:ATP-dependent Clp protease adaptor ClpS [Clostridiales bacterium]